MVLDVLKQIITEQLNVELNELTEEKEFMNDLGADSLDLFELAMAMEEKFEIEIPSEDLAGIVSIGDAVKYIEGKIA